MVKENIGAKRRKHGESVLPKEKIIFTDNLSLRDLEKRTGGRLDEGYISSSLLYEGGELYCKGPASYPSQQSDLPYLEERNKSLNREGSTLKYHAIILGNNSVTFVSPEPEGLGVVDCIKFSGGKFERILISSSAATTNQLRAKTMAQGQFKK